MTTIWITFEQEGWHCWPEAVGSRAYLKHPHRHMFHFRVELEVKEQNREIELHDFKEWCHQQLQDGFGRFGTSLFGLDFETCSCEQLAYEMCQVVVSEHQSRWCACEVSEDSECGARVELRP